MSARIWTSVVLVATVLAVGIVGALHGGPAPELAQEQTGDAKLAAAALPYLDGVRDRVSLCVIEGGNTTTAGFGADAATRYEIGSLTKTFTGVLLTDAVARGEVTFEDQVGDYLDLGNAPVAQVTLAELASHTSGLGEWGDDARDDSAKRWWVEDVRGDTIHNIDMAELLDRASADPLASRGQVRYSNIGFALLGHALAAAADQTYEQLLQTRLYDPLGMRNSGLTADSDQNPQRGYDDDGRAVPPWRLGAYAPSGGGYSTVTDLCAYVDRLFTLHERAATGGGVDPLGAVLAGRGNGWNTTASETNTIIWKTGQTGGFHSIIAIDAAASRGVVALSNSTTDLTPLARALMEEQS